MARGSMARHSQMRPPSCSRETCFGSELRASSCRPQPFSKRGGRVALNRRRVRKALCAPLVCRRGLFGACESLSQALGGVAIQCAVGARARDGQARGCAQECWPFRVESPRAARTQSLAGRRRGRTTALPQMTSILSVLLGPRQFDAG
eukprot:6773108-Prymnesium_polylepis.2